MFEKKDNPGYDQLSQDATDLIAGWLQNEWYENSFEPTALLDEA
jgi:hypothetical protein